MMWVLIIGCNHQNGFKKCFDWEANEWFWFGEIEKLSMGKE